MFSRPRSLFYPYGQSLESPLFRPGVAAGAGDARLSWAQPESQLRLRQRLITRDAAGRSSIHAPDGMVHLAIEAGDFVIMSEMTSHVILPWQPTDRSRRALTLRYYSGAAHASRPRHTSATDLEEWREHLAPLTRAMLDGVAFASESALFGSASL